MSLLLNRWILHCLSKHTLVRIAWVSVVIPSVRWGELEVKAQSHLRFLKLMQNRWNNGLPLRNFLSNQKHLFVIVGREQVDLLREIQRNHRRRIRKAVIL